MSCVLYSVYKLCYACVNGKNVMENKSRPLIILLFAINNVIILQLRIQWMLRCAHRGALWNKIHSCFATQWPLFHYSIIIRCSYMGVYILLCFCSVRKAPNTYTPRWVAPHDACDALYETKGLFCKSHKCI